MWARRSAVTPMVFNVLNLNCIGRYIVFYINQCTSKLIYAKNFVQELTSRVFLFLFWDEYIRDLEKGESYGKLLWEIISFWR